MVFTKTFINEQTKITLKQGVKKRKQEKEEEGKKKKKKIGYRLKFKQSRPIHKQNQITPSGHNSLPLLVFPTESGGEGGGRGRERERERERERGGRRERLLGAPG